MKIGILTQPLHSNYGGLLQNYALQQILISEGHNVETIDWDEPRTIKSMLSRIKWMLIYKIFPSKCLLPNYQPNKKEKSIIWQKTNYFINKYINHTDAVRSYKGFSRIAKHGTYDVFIVGSDQCWRPCYNTFIYSMFLSFLKDKNVKRISYAASFGTDKWEFTAYQTAICAPLAKQFDLITVREDSGIKLCKENLGVSAIQVLDPTMLLLKEDYIKLIKSEKESSRRGSLFNYILDPDAIKTSFIQWFAETYKLESFQVLPKYQAETLTKNNVKNHMEDCIFPGVTTWLRAFMDAEITIVDSFHGMVFSIIFNKPFWVIGNTNRGMSRFTSLLKLFQLESRLIYVDNLYETDFSQTINWEKVNSILAEKREECKSLLLNQLK